MLRNVLLAFLMPLILTVGFFIRADDSTDLEIIVRGPVSAVDITASTVTVLGIKIIVPASALNSGSNGKDISKRTNGDGGGNSGGDNGGGNGGGDGGGAPITLASLLPGTVIEIRLASDAAPLTAVELSERGGYGDGSGIKAPVQAVDATGKIITVLGVTVDISTATVDGSNDDD